MISSSFINVPPFSFVQNIAETEILSKSCIIPKKLQKQKVVFTNIKGESRHNTLASSYIYEINVIFLLSADDYSSALLTAIHSDVNSQRNVYAAQKKKLLSFKSLPQWLFISRSRNALNIYMGKFTYAFLLLSVQFWCRLNCASLRAWHRSHTYIHRSRAFRCWQKTRCRYCETQKLRLRAPHIYPVVVAHTSVVYDDSMDSVGCVLQWCFAAQWDGN